MTSAGDQAAQDLKQKQTEARVRLCAEATTECVVRSMLSTVSHKQCTTQRERAEKNEVMRNLFGQVSWTAGATKEAMQKALGRCSLDFKASLSTDQRITKHAGLIAEAFACRQREDDSGEELSIQTIASMFGKRSGMIEHARKISMMFNECIRDQAKLHTMIATHKLFQDPALTVQTYSMKLSDNLANLRINVSEKTSRLDASVRKDFLTTMMKTHQRGKQASQLFDKFKKAVSVHVANRAQSGKCFLTYDFLGEDIIVNIAEFSGFKAACSLVRVHRDFYNCDSLKKLRPHIRIRTIEGHFPHRVDHVPGLGTVPVVCKSNIVPVVIDLAITGACRDGVSYMTKKPAPGRGWLPNNLTVGQLSRDERLAYHNELGEFDSRNFKEEDVADGRYLVRLSSKLFFEDELSCKVELVHAETHIPVDDSVYEPLKVPRNYARRKDCLRTYTASKDYVPYPAYCWFYAMKLSTNDQLKMYKFKVTATGMVKAAPGRPSYRQELVTYSRAFASASTKRPFKRKLANLN